ncbi:hypothetical protein Hdeb2414_s0143g00812271 [Helianthus debilis subsp. tardiflorus]
MISLLQRTQVGLFKVTDALLYRDALNRSNCNIGREIGGCWRATGD